MSSPASKRNREAGPTAQRPKRHARAAASASAAPEPQPAPVASPLVTSLVVAPSFAERAIKFFSELEFPSDVRLPKGVAVMNPYRDPEAMRVMSEYLVKYFNDSAPRVFCFGINPGRHGAGITGVPFTSPGLLKDKLGIETTLTGQQEFSGQFVYQFIESAFGTPTDFFRQFYITSLCPLGFLQKGTKRGTAAWNNMNFYDTPQLFELVKAFMIACIKTQKSFGSGSVAICFGSGQNLKVFKQLNDEHELFDDIRAVEHPRYILQYKRSQLKDYVEKWRQTMADVAKSLEKLSVE